MTSPLTPDQWRANVDALGPAKARAWAQRNGIQIPGEEPVAPPTPRLRVNMDADYDGDAGGDTDDDIGEDTGGDLAVAPGGLSGRVAGLYRQIEANREHADEVRRQQFEEAQRAIQQQRMGPSLSERLFNLSAAFLGPKRMPGFAGAMDKVMPVLARDSGAAREGEEGRAAALLALRQRYGEQGLLSEDASLQHQLALAKLEEHAETARAKAQQPSWQINPVTGEPTALPGKGAEIQYPRSTAEAIQVPDGAFFQTPNMSGPIQMTPAIRQRAIGGTGG